MSRRETKAAKTRSRLIEAAFCCLVERGYHGTSTVAVCQQAGLARGTMLHHFPTKQALVLATLEDVLTRRATAFQAELAAPESTALQTVAGDTQSPDLGALVRRLWGAVRGPTFFAWLELVVASRTDPALEKELRSVMARFDALVTAISQVLLPPDAAGDYDLKLAVSLVFSALNGLALDLLQSEPERVEATVELLAQWVSNHLQQHE